MGSWEVTTTFMQRVGWDNWELEELLTVRFECLVSCVMSGLSAMGDLHGNRKKERDGNKEGGRNLKGKEKDGRKERNGESGSKGRDRNKEGEEEEVRRKKIKKKRENRKDRNEERTKDCGRKEIERTEE